MPAAIFDGTSTTSESRLHFDAVSEGVSNCDDINAMLPKSILPSPKIDLDARRTGLARQSRMENPIDATSLSQKHEMEVRPLVRLMTHESPVRRFKVVQQFEGVVTSSTCESIWADLEDITDSSRPKEIAEISIDEFCEDDKAILQPGSVFYWIIGYETSPAGQVRRVSEMRARRSPNWSQRALSDVKSEGERLFKMFGK